MVVYIAKSIKTLALVKNYVIIGNPLVASFQLIPSVFSYNYILHPQSN